MQRLFASRYSGESAAVARILAWTLAGYPALGSLVAYTSLPSQAASVPVRLIVLLSALWLILRLPYRLPPQPKSRWAICFVAFLCIYLLRLLFDMASDVPGAFFNSFFFLATALIPAIAVARLPTVHLQEVTIARYVATLGTVALIAALLGEVALPDVDRSLLDATGRLSFDNVNPISLGHVAVSTLIAVGFLVGRRNVKDLPWLIAGGPALLVLHMSASRGPILALVFVLLAWVVFGLTGAGRIAAIALIVLTAGLGASLVAEDTDILGRFQSVGEDQSSVERLTMQEGALQQFLDHPLTGSAHVELDSLTYPHNTVIEAAMATGVVGLALFGLLVIGLSVEITRRLLRGDRLIPLLGLQHLVAAQLSGALFASAEFWVLAAIMLLAQDREEQLHARAFSP